MCDIVCCIQTVIDLRISCILITFNKDDDDDDEDDDDSDEDDDVRQSVHTPSWHLHSTNQLLLSKPTTSTVTCSCAFSRAAPTIWYSLPHDIHIADSFRQSLCTHLHSLTFYWPSTWLPAPTIHWSHKHHNRLLFYCIVEFLVIHTY